MIDVFPFLKRRCYDKVIERESKKSPQHRLKRKKGPENKKDTGSCRPYARSVLPDLLGKFLNAAHSYFGTASRSLSWKNCFPSWKNITDPSALTSTEHVGDQPGTPRHQPAGASVFVWRLIVFLNPSRQVSRRVHFPDASLMQRCITFCIAW